MSKALEDITITTSCKHRWYAKPFLFLLGALSPKEVPLWLFSALFKVEVRTPR